MQKQKFCVTRKNKKNRVVMLLNIFYIEPKCKSSSYFRFFVNHYHIKKIERKIVSDPQSMA